MLNKALVLFGGALAASAHARREKSPDACPGYAASNVRDEGAVVTADLRLAGAACDVYGRDLGELKLLVEYQTGEFLKKIGGKGLC